MLLLLTELLALYTKLEVLDDIVHALFHLGRRKRWLSKLQILLVNILVHIKRIDTFDEVLIPHFVDLQELLVGCAILSFDVGVKLVKEDLFAVSD